MNIDKDIGDNPTPQQVKDYYDLHTGEGAANFSDEDAGITVQLWHSLAQALKENERLKEAFGEYAWNNEVIEPQMLVVELEALPGTSAEQFKEDWLFTFFDALKEGG